MLTIPDDLMQSARIDGASEWRIYAQIINAPFAGAIDTRGLHQVIWNGQHILAQQKDTRGRGSPWND